jgi:DNA gyrase inhibitor GyrI
MAVSTAAEDMALSSAVGGGCAVVHVRQKKSNAFAVHGFIFDHSQSLAGIW